MDGFIISHEFNCLCQGVLAKDHNKVGHARPASGSTGCDVVDWATTVQPNGRLSILSLCCIGFAAYLLGLCVIVPCKHSKNQMQLSNCWTDFVCDRHALTVVIALTLPFWSKSHGCLRARQPKTFASLWIWVPWLWQDTITSCTLLTQCACVCVCHIVCLEFGSQIWTPEIVHQLYQVLLCFTSCSSGPWV